MYLFLNCIVWGQASAGFENMELTIRSPARIWNQAVSTVQYWEGQVAAMHRYNLLKQ